MKKVVIVDDDTDLLHLVSSALKSQGYEVTEFKDGKSALTYLMNEENVKDLSLLVLDRILPDMDGIEVLRSLKEKYGDKIPVLILSSLSAEKDVMEGLERGAVDYVVKPFSMGVFMQKAQKLIGK